MCCRSICLLIISIISVLNIHAEIIGDSIVFVYNNWDINDTAIYEANAIRLKVNGSDTIVEANSTSVIQTMLKERLQNGDLIFETKVKMPPLGDMGRKEPLQKYYEMLYEFLERPQVYRTDSLGVMKDLCNYDAMKECVDSCFSILQNCADTLDMPTASKKAMIDGIQNMFKQATDKETILENAKMCDYYGKVIKIGTSTYKTKMPIAFFNNQEIEADVIFTCSVLEKSESAEIVSFKTDVIFNSDQLIDMVVNTLLPAETVKKSGLNNPERPYISIIQSEEYIIDVLSGIVLQVEVDKRAISLEGTRIDYSIMQLIE